MLPINEQEGRSRWTHRDVIKAQQQQKKRRK